MKQVKLQLEYDGSEFHGWQTQEARNGKEDLDRPQPSKDAVRTVQGVLEDALHRIYGKIVPVLGCSRTDAGVHAECQIVTFTVDENNGPPIEKYAHALNNYLPDDVAVCTAEFVPDDFHPQHDAKSKKYRYTILNQPLRSALKTTKAWHIPAILNFDAMVAASKHLLGKHDFKTLAVDLVKTQELREKVGKPPLPTVKTILDIHLFKRDTFIDMEIIGDGFLNKMVRTITGTLVWVGKDKFPPEGIKDVLSGQEERGPVAPAKGLTLVEIHY